MTGDDRDEPFDEFFREIERMMNDVMSDGGPHPGVGPDVHVDVHETDETVRVVADLPGVDKESIDLACDGRVLTVRAGADVEERVQLPHRVDEHSASASFNNGVLEVTFDRAEPSTDIDVN